MPFNTLHPHLSLIAARALLALLVGIQIATSCYAADPYRLPGRVVRVVDGDTIVLEVAGAQHRISLAGIGAPEKNQPWGEASTHELRRQVAGKHVVIDGYQRDRRKRQIGVVRLAGEDMNLRMVDRGLAWHYKQYADEQDPSDRDAYSAAENAAQDARRGLWSDPAPVPPWEWRRR